MLKKSNFNITRSDLIIFLIIFVILLITLLSFWPGILSYDSNYQWNQIQQNYITDSHPFLSTFVPFLLSKIFNNISIIMFFQIIIFSIIWTLICKQLGNSHNFKIQIIYTIIIGFLPIVSIYAITFWKDIIYSYMLLLIIFFIMVGITKKFNYSFLDLTFLSISLIIAMCYRHNGLIIIPLIILIFIYLMKKYKVHYKKIVYFIILLTLLYSSIQIPKKLMVQPSLDILSFKDGMSLFLVGSLLSSDVIDNPDDLEYLDTIMPINEWKEKYNPYLINSIGGSESVNKNVLSETSSNLINILIKYSFRNPKVLFLHYLKADALLWNPLPAGYNYVFPFSVWEEGRYSFKGNVNPIFKFGNMIFEKEINITMSNKFIEIIFYRPAIPMYLSIVLAFMFSKKYKSKLYFLLIMPMLLNVFSLIPVNLAQDLRYVYINYLTFIFMFGLYIFDFKTIPNSNLLKSLTKENACNNIKILIIVPVYNEELNIINVRNQLNTLNNIDYIFINDGSKDNTEKILSENDVPYISLIHNLGIGGAVQTGYKYAYENNYDYAIQFDGDGQHDVKYIPDILKPLEDMEADLVIGSRFVKKDLGEFKSTKMRQFGISIISFFIKLFTGKKIYDTTSGFRACNKDIIKKFSNSYPLEYPEPVSTVELLKNHYKIKEVPVKMNERKAGKSSIKGWKDCYYMINVVFSIIICSIRRYKK